MRPKKVVRSKNSIDPPVLLGQGALVLEGAETVGKIIMENGHGSFLLPFALTKPQEIAKSKKVTVKTGEDGKKVLKVGDAIEVLEEYFNSGVILSQLAAGFVKAFVSKEPSDVASQALPVLAAKMRAKALKQTNPKKFVDKKYWTRRF